MGINFSEANERIRGWGVLTESKLKTAINDLGIRHRENSASPKAAIDSLSTRFRETDGLTSRISYNIPKHMIFVHKGVGRGTPVQRVGQNGRKAKPWFNPVIDQNIDELADIVAEELGSSIINNLLIK